MSTNIQKAFKFGHEIWLDNLSREMLNKNEISDWLDQGVTGMTSNPSIFLKSISNTELYPEFQDIENSFAGPRIVEAINKDIAQAQKAFYGLYESSHKQSGYVSIELNPHFADDYEKSLLEATWIASQLQELPNFMIKIAANVTGIQVMEELLYRGYNINMTLIFSADVIEEIMNAYARAMRKRLREKLDCQGIRLVMSFFISRIDVYLNERFKDDEDLEDLHNKTALALAYNCVQKTREIANSDVYDDIADFVQVPRLLWASTATKDAQLDPSYYVGNLVIPQTVDTVPEATLKAFLNAPHVKSCCSFDDEQSALEAVQLLEEKGIDLNKMTEDLFVSGLKQFENSYDQFFITLKGPQVDLKKEYENLLLYYQGLSE